MAEPQTELERRLYRIELAISTLAYMLGSSADGARIEKILRGEKAEESNENASPQS